MDITKKESGNSIGNILRKFKIVIKLDRAKSKGLSFSIKTTAKTLSPITNFTDKEAYQFPKKTGSSLQKSHKDTEQRKIEYSSRERRLRNQVRIIDFMSRIITSMTFMTIIFTNITFTGLLVRYIYNLDEFS